MTIVIISRGIPSTKYPQLGCFELDQAKALKRAGHKVIMLALDGAIGKRWKKIGLHRSHIEDVACYEFFGLPSIYIRKFFSSKKGLDFESLILKRIFSKIIKENGKIDLIHAHFLFQIYTGTKLKHWFNIPLVGTEHLSSLTESPINPTIAKLAHLTYPKTNGLISVSENLRKRIIELSGRESKVIHNLIDTSNLKPALELTSNKVFTIIGLGSLIKRKGFDILINAFAESYLKDEMVILKIIGGGEEKDRLQRLIKDKGLENQIVLSGTMTKKEIFEELHNADLFVLPSRLENFSVAIIEATANGVPAIATLCGGIEEYPVPNVTKIPVDDVNALKVALETNFKNSKKINRKEIQDITLQHFSPENIAREIEMVYKEVLSDINYE